jgi:CRISPR system Cascade subunit CasB
MSDAPETMRNWAVTARSWWRSLQPYDEQGQSNWSGDRGALARLRRASTPSDALLEPAVLDLYRRLGFSSLSGERLALTAVAAMVLAHARKDTRGVHPAHAVGRVTFADKEFETAAMKPLRFQRLLAARAPEELAHYMRRLVQLAGNDIDVGRLAADIVSWRDDEAGDQVRTRWAYEYLAAGRDAPGADTAPSSSPNYSSEVQS